MTSFIHKISKCQGGLIIKISSMGPRCALTLILAVLQPSNSQSEKPILKSYWHLTACRYHAFFFMKQDRKDWGIPGIFGDFLRFSLLSFSATQFKAWHSLHLETERYMTKPDGATVSSVRPRQGRPLNMYPQLCSLLFLDFWLFFLYCDRMKSVIHT